MQLAAGYPWQVTERDRADVLDRLHLPGSDEARADIARRRRLYLVTSVVVTAIAVLAVADATRAVDAFGVSSDHVAAAGGGYELDVEYGTTSRPGLATPFAIEVRRPGGFDGPVTVAVDHHYMQMWDENGFYPTPSSETTDGRWLLWEFDPPEGDVLRFTYDARIEPAVQQGRGGRVAVMDGGAPVVEVDFHTRVMP